MRKIIIIPKDKDENKWIFSVAVSDQEGSTRHEVSLHRQDYELLANSEITPEELVRRSFEFLLDREAKSEILDTFDLKEIQRYFPEYSQEIKKILG